MATSVAGIAARSIADGRHGIITRSASRAAFPLAGLAGVYTRACAPARVGLANSANFVGTELRNGPGITARTGHLAAGQRRLPTRPNGFVDVSTWRSRRAELNREPLSHEEWSG